MAQNNSTAQNDPTAPSGSTAEQTSTPRPHGRRARQLTPEEQAELDRRRAEYERFQTTGAGQSSSPEAASSGTAAGENDPAAAGPGSEPTSEPVLPAEPASPSVRRFGRRAHIIEVEDAPDGAASADDAGTTGQVLTTDADGVELGELPADEAPDPRPAPRFEGRVLRRPERGAGTPLVWIVWILVALAVITVIVLLMTGVLGSGETGALGSPTGTMAAISSFPPTTGEVITA